MNNRREYNNLVKYIKKLYDINIHNSIIYSCVTNYLHIKRRNFIKKLLLLNLVNFNREKINYFYFFEIKSNYLIIADPLDSEYM